LTLHNEPLPLAKPFRISGHVFDAMPATVVTLRDGESEGCGEAAGVYYLDDKPEGMLATLEALRERIEAGLTRAELRELLPPGGARNALDCALWELESQRAGVPVWQLAGLDAPRPLLTTFTVGADEPA
jgi:L-alanine-DL-glutamate epimerase-like enolase superfamily enzyme